MTFAADTSEQPKISWRQALSPRFWTSPPILFLIAVNLLPLAGVVFWQWDLFTLMMLYWMETGVIGFYTALHMILVGRWSALFFVPFFTVHFGGFMAGHGAFLWILFADDNIKHASSVWEMGKILLIDRGLWVTLAAMFVCHGVFFIIQVLRPWLHRPLAPVTMVPRPLVTRGGKVVELPANAPEWQKTMIQNAPAAQDAGQVMMRPYGRIIVMHVTIIFGAMLMTIFGTKLVAFIFLIVLKTLVDVVTHVRRMVAPVTMTTVAAARR